MTETDTSTTTTAVRTSSGAWIGAIGIVVGIGGLAAGGLALEQLSRITPLLSTQMQQQEERTKYIDRVTDAIASHKALIATQQETLSVMRAEIAGLHEALAERATQAPDDAAIRALIASAIAEQGADNTAITERVAALEGMKTLPDNAAPVQEAVYDDTDTRAVRYAILRELVLEGKPHREALERFKESLGDGLAETASVRDAFSVLDSDDAVPTASSLYVTFSDIPVRIRTEAEPYSPDAPGGSWWKRSTDSLKGLVKIEKIDSDVTPNTRIERARALVEMGDISAAAELIRALPDADREAYEDWLADAARFSVVRDALAVLRAASLTAHESSAVKE